MNFITLKNLSGVQPTGTLYHINGVDLWLIGIRLSFRSLAPPTKKIGAGGRQSITKDQRALPELETRDNGKSFECCKMFSGCTIKAKYSL